MNVLLCLFVCLCCCVCGQWDRLRSGEYVARVSQVCLLFLGNGRGNSSQHSSHSAASSNPSNITSGGRASGIFKCWCCCCRIHFLLSSIHPPHISLDESFPPHGISICHAHPLLNCLSLTSLGPGSRLVSALAA